MHYAEVIQSFLYKVHSNKSLKDTSFTLLLYYNNNNYKITIL